VNHFQNDLKLAYCNVGFQTFSGANTPNPSFKEGLGRRGKEMLWTMAICLDPMLQGVMDARMPLVGLDANRLTAVFIYNFLGGV